MADIKEYGASNELKNIDQVINTLNGVPGTSVGSNFFALNPPSGTTTTLYDNGAVAYNGSASYYGTTPAPNGGIRLDSVTDDTADWQAFSDFLTGHVAGGGLPGNGRRGVVKAGTSIISSPINFSRRPGWSVHGAGPISTNIKQMTDNVAIFNLGSDTDSLMHSWGLDGLSFSYANSQPSTNTNANPILFSAMGFEAYLTNLFFDRGSYAMKIASGIVPTWGTWWNNLQFSNGLTGGAYDLSAAGASGTPNNSWGRCVMKCDNMVGPVFKQWNGYNWTVDTMEFLSNNFNAQLMTIASGASVTIGAIKLEVGVFTASTTLIAPLGNANMRIGEISIAGSPLSASGAGVIVQIIGGGAGSYVDVGSLTTAAISLSGGAVAYFGGAGQLTIGNLGAVGAAPAAGWSLTNAGGSTQQETLTVQAWQRGYLSQNKGDASYAITLGDPNTIAFETAFTAQRTVTLPGTDATLGNLPNGLKYRLRFKGAINGANTALIVCNGATLLTQTTDLVIVEFTYRRNPSHPQNGWVLTAYETGLPA